MTPGDNKTQPAFQSRKAGLIIHVGRVLALEDICQLQDTLGVGNALEMIAGIAPLFDAQSGVCHRLSIGKVDRDRQSALSEKAY